MKSFRKNVVLAVVLALLSMLGPTSAQENEYAILIVGDEGNAEMLREEKVLIGEMAKKIRLQSPAQRLPIYSYHFNKERERAYCETKLNVLAEDLLFVGVVRLKDKVPLKVIYRIDRIGNSSRSANDILMRAEEILAEGTQTVEVTPSSSPAVTPSPSASPSRSPSVVVEKTPASTSTSVNSGSGFRIQLGSFAQLKYAQDKMSEAKRAQLEVSVVESKGPDGDTLYKVLSPLMKQRQEADGLLEQFQKKGFKEAFMTRSGDS